MSDQRLETDVDAPSHASPRNGGQVKPFGGVWSRLCRSRVVAWARPRGPRRLLVGASSATLVAMPLVGWSTDSLWWTASLLVPYLGLNVLLAASTNGLLDRKLSSLDERERMVRMSVFREPYVVGVTIGLLVGAIGFTVLLSEEAWAIGAMLAMYSSVYLIPTSVLAWKLPDEVRDEG